MIRHVVMWKLKDQAKGRSRRDNAREVKILLESLAGKIPGLLKIEAGIDESRTDASADLVLISDFRDRDALELYLNHPEHQIVADFIGDVRATRTVVDYEV